MRFDALSRFVLLSLVLGLSACAGKPPLMQSAGPFRVSAVKVELAPGVGTSYLTERLLEETHRQAVAYDRGGALKELNVRVVKVAYKSAALVLLMEQRSVLEADVRVSDVATGRTDAEFHVTVPDSEGQMGNIGRIVNAVTNDPRKDDQALAIAFARLTLEGVYGSDARSYGRRITAEATAAAAANLPPEPEPAPAPAR